MSRAQEEGTWRSVGVCLAYVDVFLREHHAAHGGASMNPKRSPEYVFINWSRKNHAFDSVRARPAAPGLDGGDDRRRSSPTF